MTAAKPPGEGKGESPGTVVRVVRLLAAMSEADQPVGVAAIAARLNLAVSTVHRLLKLLTDEGMVTWDADTHLYAVGTEFYRISANVVSHLDLPRIARPYMHSLAAQFNETVLLGILATTRRSMMFAERADGTQALQYRIDMHAPNSLVLGASGKSILAFMSDAEIEAVLETEAGAPYRTVTPLPTLAELAPELATIRDNGYSVSEGEKLAGARGVAAPVMGPNGVLGCLCLTSPADRLPHASLATIAAAISESAQSLSDTLGARNKDI